MAGVSIEIWLSAAYAIFLLLVAGCLERLALHCHRQSGRIRTSGFKFRHALDAWECPTGQFLTRASIEPQRLAVVYRAPARACNGCALKLECAPSGLSREIAIPSENWVQTQIGRFHRGFSLSLCTLAGVLLVIEFIRSRGLAEHLLLAGVLVWIAASAKRLAFELGACSRNAPSLRPYRPSVLAGPRRQGSDLG